MIAKYNGREKTYEEQYEEYWRDNARRQLPEVVKNERTFDYSDPRRHVYDKPQMLDNIDKTNPRLV